MTRVLAAALLALLVATAAPAQTADSVAAAIRVEWARVADRPGIEGYVYNDSPYRIGLVRLRVDGRDAPDQAPTPTLAWVYGDVPARGRWYFRVRLPRGREVVAVAVESFHLIARESPESP